jgi:DNA-directed RNA polymerase subunit RPC12/RpoP
MKFVMLRAYDHYVEAHLQLQRLEAEGIRAALQDEYTVSIDPVLSHAVGGIKIMVPESQWERARRLLEIWQEEYDRAVACPACGHQGLERVSALKKPMNWITLLLTWLLGNYAVSSATVYRCVNCGQEWDELPDSEPVSTRIGYP